VESTKLAMITRATGDQAMALPVATSRQSATGQQAVASVSFKAPDANL